VKTLVSNVSVVPLFVDFLNTFIQKVKTQESIVTVAPKFYTKNTPVPSGCGSVLLFLQICK
jgi:hypothetical protein